VASLAFYAAQAAALPLNVWLLTRLALPGRSAASVAAAAWRGLRSPAGRGLAALAAAAYAANALQNLVDPWCDGLAVGLHGVTDFGRFFRAVEGDAVAAVQRWSPVPAAAAAAWVYITVFPALFAFTAAALLAEERREGAAALALAPPLCVAAALPFFVLMPVREVWASEAGRARLLLDLVHPALEPAFRLERGIGNNFPSLHAALSVAAALAAARHGSRRLAWTVGATAAAVVASTFYLGFHWLCDAAAGAACGAAGLLAAERLVRADVVRWTRA